MTMTEFGFRCKIQEVSFPLGVPSFLWVQAAAVRFGLNIWVICPPYVGGDWKANADDAIVTFGDPSAATKVFVAVSPCWGISLLRHAGTDEDLASAPVSHTWEGLCIENLPPVPAPAESDAEDGEGSEGSASDENEQSSDLEMHQELQEADRMSLQDFLSDPDFVNDVAGTLEVTNDAFYPDVSIDFRSTSANSLVNLPGLTWSKTFDIDAIVASFKLADVSRGLRGALAINEFVAVTSPNEIKAIKRHSKSLFAAKCAFRLGEVKWGLSAKDSLYLYSDMPMTEKTLASVSSAVGIALSLPCLRERPVECACGTIGAFHISNRRSAPPLKKVGNLVEVVSPDVIPCIFRILDSQLRLVFGDWVWRVMVKTVGCKASTVSTTPPCLTALSTLINFAAAEKASVDVCLQATPTCDGESAAWTFASFEALRRAYGARDGELYPQAFLGKYGNFYSHRNLGIYKKFNIYSTVHRLVTGKLEDSPPFPTAIEHMPWWKPSFPPIRPSRC